MTPDPEALVARIKERESAAAWQKMTESGRLEVEVFGRYVLWAQSAQTALSWSGLLAWLNSRDAPHLPALLLEAIRESVSSSIESH